MSSETSMPQEEVFEGRIEDTTSSKNEPREPPSIEIPNANPISSATTITVDAQDSNYSNAHI